jgi:hypothetical protein
MREMDAKSRLLRVAYRHTINDANLKAGFERFRALGGGNVEYGAFCNAVTACLHDGLIREPVRLPEGALQCHWHLELTPEGAEVARSLPEDVADGRAEPGHDG